MKTLDNCVSNSVAVGGPDGQRRGMIVFYREIDDQMKSKLRNCLECGKCCGNGHFAHIAIDNPKECDVAPEHRQVIANRVFLKFTDTGWCPYHDQTTHRCTIYQKCRPSVCNTFRRGQEIICYDV